MPRSSRSNWSSSSQYGYRENPACRGTDQRVNSTMLHFLRAFHRPGGERMRSLTALFN